MGWYLGHLKETCLVGLKGKLKDRSGLFKCKDVIMSPRRIDSQKPEELNETVETTLCLNGNYLEIFGRKQISEKLGDYKRCH